MRSKLSVITLVPLGDVIHDVSFRISDCISPTREWEYLKRRLKITIDDLYLAAIPRDLSYRAGIGDGPLVRS